MDSQEEHVKQDDEDVVENRLPCELRETELERRYDVEKRTVEPRRSAPDLGAGSSFGRETEEGKMISSKEVCEDRDVYDSTCEDRQHSYPAKKRKKSGMKFIGVIRSRNKALTEKSFQE